MMITIALCACLIPCQDAWKDKFDVERAALADTGKNDYMSLMPGHRQELRSSNGRLVISVLNETKLVDGVMTRIVEEREWEDGELIEVSRNYFAIDGKTKDIYYFGEAVEIYKDGKIVGHDGAWESGKDGARFGLMMPANPMVGQMYYQEIAPKVAMDRAKIVDLNSTVKVTGKDQKGCLKIEETTPLEKGTGYKYYLKGVGMVRDADFSLWKPK